MKRVLHVVSALEQGGVESVILNYFSNIDKTKIIFDFLIIYGWKNEELKEYYTNILSEYGCNIYVLENPPRKIFKHIKEIKNFFNSHDYETVHINAANSFRYIIAKEAKKSGVKTVIYHSHTSFCEKNSLLHKALKKRINRWCDYKFACSDAAGKYMYCGDYQIVHNAIDLYKFSYNETLREAIRDRYGLSDKIVIGNVGRFVASKNQDFLVETAYRMREISDKFSFLLVGDGQTLEKIKEKVKDKGLGQRFIFVGNAGTDTYKYYNAFDVFAFPSIYEGLSMVIIESQTNGVPVIMSDKLGYEHKVAENTKFLPIDNTEDNYKLWIASILSFVNKRTDNIELLRNSGYDIHVEAKKLQEFYLTH